MRSKLSLVFALCLAVHPAFTGAGTRSAERPARAAAAPDAGDRGATGLTPGRGAYADEFRRLGPSPFGGVTDGAGAAQTSVAGAGAGRRLALRPCGPAQTPKDALCGKYEVFEDREARAGRKISLNVLVLPALNGKPAPDPVFYLAGGPGAAATGYAEAAFMAGLRRTRDVVLVDQRGTGESNPLRCQLYGDPDDMRGYFGEAFPADAVRACRAQLERVADLRLYTTPVAVADLDEVREALGYERVNLYGGSYGTTSALAYLHFFPRRVRTVAVFGVAPLDYKLPLPFARGVEHALGRLFADCAADDKCRAAFPELRKEFEAVVARLDKAPATFEAVNPLNGRKRRLTLTRTLLLEHVRLMLYIPDVVSELPLFIHEMHRGEYARFASVAYQVLRGIDSVIARGMQFSVLCAEDLPFITEDDIRRETAGTFYGDARVRSSLRACEEWPKGKLPARFLEPVASDVPVLLLSGEVDPVTPPPAAAALLSRLPNGRHVIARNATHNSYECLEGLVADFIERGTARGLDASCADRIQRLPFVTSPPAPAR